MFRKTAITFGLAMIAGTGLAAQSGQDISANTDADISTGGARIGVDTGISLKSRFDALDSDDNGVISRSDASGNARLQSMFDSLDTGGSIEKDAKSAGAEGISYEQFKAGMQAEGQGRSRYGGRQRHRCGRTTAEQLGQWPGWRIAERRCRFRLPG